MKEARQEELAGRDKIILTRFGEEAFPIANG